MKDKFTMTLVWHNCKTYPPKEDFNQYLVASNGHVAHEVSWRRGEGYSFKIGGVKVPIRIEELEYWYWADLIQTTRKCPDFDDTICDWLKIYRRETIIEESEDFIE